MKVAATLPEPDPARLGAAEALAARGPVPAQVGPVLCGTAGWTDKTLIQSRRFYPEGASSPTKRLQHYARHFRLVEVDATYYTLIAPETVERWVRDTPSDFRFDVKAHPVFTGHPVDLQKLPRELREAIEREHPAKRRVYPDKLGRELRTEIEDRFFASVDPLGRSDRLGCVMLQFPPWFTATRGNAKRIESLRETWPDVPFSVEFRHRSWLETERRDRVFDLLTRCEMSYVAVDEPDVEAAGVPPVVKVTRPALAIVRFHGHNRAGWTKKGASVHERFDYLYTPEELRAWEDPVRQLTGDAESVHAIFNNCVRHYAVIGAQGLAAILAPEATAAAAEP